MSIGKNAWATAPGFRGSTAGKPNTRDNAREREGDEGERAAGGALGTRPGKGGGAGERKHSMGVEKGGADVLVVR